MSATFSYANILHAVGQVLDEVGVKSFAIQEEEDGLFVEGFGSEGELQLQIRYSIADLYELVSKVEHLDEEHSSIPATGILHQFLSDHRRELVGTSL